MGIQSTQSIKRFDAIDRIVYIDSLIRMRRYRELEEAAFEPEYDVEEYVRDYIDIDARNIMNWSDTMIEDQMDEPYFRLSMFDNYEVYEEEW